eukprot:CAMPEP_0115836828 /NCGR_PEP_ID=MMETSP0287-20121206/4909_1 /TAXON_ID=412157 /ORGANISM="Chrysochromulina rotalis, Strain UIO044" /LENGTH=177 /DNA_ID=CAMNT_0003290325 /DNA_START=118 /DNA_END=651 /DNA_ORIENTATION=+
MARNINAVIVTETKAPGRILACNAAWTQLCGYAPEEALGKTPSMLQGKETSKRKARAYTRQCLQNKFMCEENGFASRQGRARVKIINYTRDGRPFVHCLQTSRVMDEDTGEEYFVTESHEETDDAIYCAMIKGQEAPCQHPIRDGALYLFLVSLCLAPSVLPVIQVLLSDLSVCMNA